MLASVLERASPSAMITPGPDCAPSTPTRTGRWTCRRTHDPARQREPEPGPSDRYPSPSLCPSRMLVDLRPDAGQRVIGVCRFRCCLRDHRGSTHGLWFRLLPSLCLGVTLLDPEPEPTHRLRLERLAVHAGESPAGQYRRHLLPVWWRFVKQLHQLIVVPVHPLIQGRAETAALLLQRCFQVCQNAGVILLCHAKMVPETR